MGSWKRRVVRGCLVLGGLAALGAMVGSLYLRSQAGGLEAQIERAKAHGLVLDFDEFTDVSKIPSAENAAAGYLAAGRTVEALGAPASAWLSKGGYFTVAAASAEKRRRDLQPFAEVFNQLEAASIKPQCRFTSFSVDGDELAFERFAQLKQFAKLLCARAALEAFEGRWDRAGASLSTAARVARHAGDEQTMIAMLVRIGIESIVLRTAQHALGQPTLDARALKSMQRVLAVLGDPPDLSVFLRGEVCFMFNAFDAAERAVPGLPGTERAQMPKWVPSAFRRTAVRAYQARILLRWNDFYDRLGNPPVDPVAVKLALGQMLTEIGGSLHPADYVLLILVPVHEQAADSILTLSARRRVFAQGLAVLEFRHRTRQLPKALDEVGNPLMDPFDNQPLRYRPTEDGFVVYSIGKDLKDDGGGKGDEAFDYPAK